MTPPGPLLLLDGAMGTALIAAGLGLGALPESWVLSRPDEVSRVHAAHAAAGAGLVLSCTFNLAAPRLRAAGVTATLDEVARRAVELARRAAPGARVAGAVGPTLLEREGASALRPRYEEAFRALAAAGADLLWCEGQWEWGEAGAALEAALSTGLPAVVTFGLRQVEDELVSGSGEPGISCLRRAASAGAAAVGVNCVLPGAPLAALLSRAAKELPVPLVAKPSAGLPGQVVSPGAFGAWAAELRAAGASWIGGCCGADAPHLAAAAAALGGRAA